MKKMCTKCLRKLPLDKFWRSKTSRDGREHQCSDCRLSHKREYQRRLDEVTNGVRIKLCRKCRHQLNIMKFELDPKGESGLSDYCIGCLHEKKMIEEKDRIIKSLSTHLNDTESALRKKEQYINWLEERLATYTTRVETASLFQRIFKTW